jgi:hypothetical protein
LSAPIPRHRITALGVRFIRNLPPELEEALLFALASRHVVTGLIAEIGR